MARSPKPQVTLRDLLEWERARDRTPAEIERVCQAVTAWGLLQQGYSLRAAAYILGRSPAWVHHAGRTVSASIGRKSRSRAAVGKPTRRKRERRRVQ